MDNNFIQMYARQNGKTQTMLDQMLDTLFDEHPDFAQFMHNKALVEKTCDTFTRLLLSITPYKAKEFVEKNCARVTQKIKDGLKYVPHGTMEDEDGDNEEES